MQNPKKRDMEIQQLMEEESSRCRQQPRYADNLERRRRISEAAKRFADPTCSREAYITMIRDDFGLQDGPDEFLQFMLDGFPSESSSGDIMRAEGTPK